MTIEKEIELEEDMEMFAIDRDMGVGFLVRLRVMDSLDNSLSSSSDD